jgi:hypothetical protein
MKKKFHAKAQRRKALPRFYVFFFAPLRLCVRALSSLMVLNRNPRTFVQSQFKVQALKVEL